MHLQSAISSRMELPLPTKHLINFECMHICIMLINIIVFSDIVLHKQQMKFRTLGSYSNCCTLLLCLGITGLENGPISLAPFCKRRSCSFTADLELLNFIGL